MSQRRFVSTCYGKAKIEDLEWNQRIVKAMLGGVRGGAVGLQGGPVGFQGDPADFARHLQGQMLQGRLR
jgi:hypothetical protein